MNQEKSQVIVVFLLITILVLSFQGYFFLTIGKLTIEGAILSLIFGFISFSMVVKLIAKWKK